MNRHCFRLIFSKSLGFLIPVAEITTTTGKGRQAGQTQGRAAPNAPGFQLQTLFASVLSVIRPDARRGGLKGAMLRRILVTAALLPAAVYADMVVDPNGGANTPGMSSSANGVPVVNIVDPNAKGLSHNKFQSFDVVQPGVIFNNSTTDGVSQIGGYTMHNPNLNHQANAILVDVTGTNPSSLAGALEVFGGTADLIISNQNGISLNGVSTINANSLTTTTGKAVDSPDGLQFLVDGGKVKIEAGGVDTSGLTYFDVVARSIELQGAAGSQDQKTDINLVAGLNTYNAATRTATVNSTSGANTPEFAIDGSLAGAMYGHNISLTSTESGAGVRHQGLIKSSADIAISANGDVGLATLVAGGKVGIDTTGSIAIGNGTAGQGIDAQKAVTLHAGHGITVSNDIKGETLQITASDLLVQSANLIATQAEGAGPVSAITIKVGNFTLSGTLVAVNSAHIPYGPNQPLVLHNGKLMVKVNGTDYSTDFTLSATAMILSANGVSIEADNFLNDGGVIQDTSKSGINIAAQHLVNKGIVTTKGDLNLVADVLENLCTGINQTLCVGFLAGGDANVQAGSLTNDAGLGAAGNMNLTLNSDSSNGVHGSISGGKSLQVQQAPGSAVHLSSDGELYSGADLLMVLNELSLGGASITSAGGSATMQITGTLESAGKIVVGKDLNITATDVIANVGSSMSAAHDITIAAQKTYSSTDQTLVRAENTAHIEAQESLSNGGIIYGANRVDLLTDGQLTNGAGVAIAGQTITLKGDALINESGATIGASELVDIDVAGDLINDASVITAGSQVNLHAGGTVSNTNGSQIIGGDVTIDAAQVINNDAMIVASDLIINSAGDVDFSGPSSMVYGDSIAINSLGNLHNSDGSQVYAETVASLNSLGSLTNDSDAVIYGANGVKISANGDVTNASGAQINSDENVDITASNVTNTEAAAISADHVVINASQNVLNAQDAAIVGQSSAQIKALNGSVTNTDGAVMSASALDIQAQDITNQNAGKLRGDDITLTASNNFKNTNGGSIKASNSVTIDSKNFAASDSEILASKDIHIATDTYANTGNIASQDTATLTIKHGGDLTLSTTQKAPVAAQLLTLNAHDVTVNDALNNPGSIQINASGKVQNNDAIVTGKSLFVDASESIVNNTHALIWAADDIMLKAGTAINNLEDALIMAGDAISLTAHDILNYAGRISAGGDLTLEASNITNQGISTGGLVQGPSTSADGYYKWNHDARYDEMWISMELPSYSSNRTTKQAVMESGGNVAINQGEHKGTGSNVTNQDGLMVATGNMAIDGNLKNMTSHDDLALSTYLKTPSTVTITVKDKLAKKNPTTQVYSSMWDFLDQTFGHDDKHKIWGAYYYYDGNTAAALKNINDPKFNQIMAATLGADWRTQDYETLSARWNAYASGQSPDPVKSYYAATRSEIATGGNFVHTGGSFENGGGVVQQKTVDVSIGKNDTTAIAGDFDSSYAYKSAFDPKAPLSELENAMNPSYVQDNLINNDMLFQQTTKPAPFDPDAFAAAGLQGKQNGANGSATMTPIVPLYETRIEYVDQSQFYGSSYFFESVGYHADAPVSVIGDAYFDNMMITQTIQATSGTYMTVTYGVSGADMSKLLMDNAGVEAERLGLTVGVPLTQEQYDSLELDIVWYEPEVVDGVLVLVPKVYYCPATLAAMDTTKEADSVIQAGGTLTTDNTDFTNVNGVVKGHDVTITSSGDVQNQATGGSQGGIYASAEGGKLIVDAAGDVNNQGATVKGNHIQVKAGGDITASTTMTYDQDGSLVSRSTGDILGSGTASTVHLTAGKDVVLTGADVAAGRVAVDATNLIMNDVKEVSSSHKDTTTSGFASRNTTMQESASATGVGSNIVAGSLNINTSNDVLVNGSNMTALHSRIDVGGSMIAKTSENLSYDHQTTQQIGWVAGASVSAGGYVASASASTAHGGKSYAGEMAEGGFSTNGGASAHTGLEISSSEHSNSSVTQSNSQLNLGTGKVTVEDTFDFGGADINTAKGFENAKLRVKAGDIQTTKYESVSDDESSAKGMFIGHTASADSVFIDVSNDIGKLATDASEGMSVAPGLTTLEMLGDVERMAVGSWGMVSGGVAIGGGAASGQTLTKTENTNQVGGNVSFTSTKGDITLTGVKTTNPDAVVILNAGDHDVNLNASKSTTTSTSKSNVGGINATETNSWNPITGDTVSGTVGVGAKHNDSSQDNTHYTNTDISGSHVIVRANDLNMVGANISGKVNADLSGELNITSVQDTQNYTHTLGAGGASAGVAVNSHTLFVVPSFVGGVGGVGGQDYDNYQKVEKQSGISGTADSSIHVGGDMNLTGGYVAGGGNLQVDGAVNAKDLTDSRNKDGGYGGGGVGFNPNGIGGIGLMGGRVDQVHYSADNKATVDMNLTGKDGGAATVNGNLNTDMNNRLVVNQDQKIAGNDIKLGIPT
ncbi:hemagglutinin repeat-containing protein, partial [Pseudomonas sp. Sample_21]|uniref:two-partner secretion domain-containing protein n=1 Tax=Pseudomonas sp. Sample_21 TaxID=2448265 RepID=UPI0010318E26